MEIKINNYIIKNKLIMGVIGNYKNFINKFEIIDFESNNIYIDNKKLNKSEKKELQRSISIIHEDIGSNYDSFTVYEYLKYQVFDNMLEIKNYHKKITNSLKIVGLDKKYLEKRMIDLSYTEKKLIQLAAYLLPNPNIMILENFFDGLDINNRKKILTLFNQMIEKYNKFIIICSNDTEFIYKYTKYLLVIGTKIISGNTSDIFENNKELLEKNDIDIPYTIRFTDLVLKVKNIKLNYNKDIRDLIKDIYKKV